MIQVVVVEDDTPTRHALALELRKENLKVYEASDVLACSALLRQERVDAVVLDVSPPEVHRWGLLRELRQQSDVAILVVSPHQSPESQIEALDFGADDYLIKPVHHGELAARVRSVVRRRYRFRDRKKRVGQWTVDIDLRTVTAGETTSELTRGEFEILVKLIELGSRIVSRETLLAAVSRRPKDADLRTIDTLVSRLRRKLGDDQDSPTLIVTVPGFGYRLGASAEET